MFDLTALAEFTGRHAPMWRPEGFQRMLLERELRVLDNNEYPVFYDSWREQEGAMKRAAADRASLQAQLDTVKDAALPETEAERKAVLGLALLWRRGVTSIATEEVWEAWPCFIVE